MIYDLRVTVQTESEGPKLIVPLFIEIVNSDTTAWPADVSLESFFERTGLRRE
jgi:hypothetical protein